MKATFRIEIFGNNSKLLRFYQSMISDVAGNDVANAIVGKIPAQYYVAEITGTDPKWKYQREFVKAKYDYKNSNSIGSRGVYAWYIIESGKIYEVKSQTSWKSFDKYYCTVNPVSGDIEKIGKEEVDECLKRFSE